MHKSADIFRRALLPVFFACVVPASHAVLIDFDSGYTNASTLAGIDDPDVPGSAAWTSNASGSFVAVANGSGLAAGIVGGPGAVVNRLDLTAAVGGSGGIDFTKEVQLRADIKLVSLDGTGNALILALGNADITNPTGNTWTTLTIGGAGSATAPIYLSRSNGSGGVTQTAINVTGTDSEFADFTALNTYLTVDIRFNPVSLLYTHVSIGGTDYTSSFSSFALPLLNTNTSAGYTLSLIKSSSQTAEIHVDNIFVGNTAIPEPASAATLLGAAGLAACLLRRRRA